MSSYQGATRFLIPLVIVGVVLSACAPGSSVATDQTTPAQAVQQPAAPKVLTIGVVRLVNTLQRRIVGAVAGAGEPQIWQIAHEHLVVENGELSEPRLATEEPSIEHGTWRVF